RHHRNARIGHGSILAVEATASRVVISSSSWWMTGKQEVDHTPRPHTPITLGLAAVQPSRCAIVPPWAIRTREYSAVAHRYGAMQLETSKNCVFYARDADVRSKRRSRAAMNSSERETQPNSAWITRSDAS